MTHFENDLRKTRVWQEAVEEGIEIGVEKGHKAAVTDVVRRCLDAGMSIKAVSDLLGLSVQEVRRLSKSKES